MVLSGPIYALNETDRQLPVESFLSQNNRLQTDTSPRQPTRQDNIKADAGKDNMHQQDSAQQVDREAKQLEVELRKLLLLSCPR
jgi:hypothetical protein